MIRDITLGQYYPGKSKVHDLDPRVKIILTIIFIVSLFIVNDFIGLAFAFLVLLVVIAVSKVPVGYILRGLKPVVIIVSITLVINLFMIPGEVIATIPPGLTITKEGLFTAFFMGIRLVLLIMCASVLTLTTKPIQLTDAIESLLKPLGKLGLPTHELAMMMSIALRFIPTLLEETDKIMKAQQARGADFESGNIFKRAKNMIPILIPLFISAFRIAQDLAMAMEARCYHGGGQRTRMNGMKMKGKDWFALLLGCAFLACAIFEPNLFDLLADKTAFVAFIAF